MTWTLLVHADTLLHYRIPLGLLGVALSTSIAQAQQLPEPTTLKCGEYLPVTLEELFGAASPRASFARYREVRGNGPLSVLVCGALSDSPTVNNLWVSNTSASSLLIHAPTSDSRFLPRTIGTQADISSQGDVVQSSLIPRIPELWDSGATGFADTLWVHEWPTAGGTSMPGVPIGADATAAEVLGAFWSAFGLVSVSPAGDPVYTASTSDDLGSLSNQDLLIKGRLTPTSGHRILQSGESLASNVTLAVHAPVRKIAVAPTGGSVLAHVRLEPDSSGSRDAVVHWMESSNTKSVIAEQGMLIGEGMPGARWREFGPIAISEDDWECGLSSWYVAGGISSRHGDDWVLVRNGNVLLKNGDALCNDILDGQPLALDVNRAGDYAVLWLTMPPSGTGRPLPTLIVNGFPIGHTGQQLSEHSFVSFIHPHISISERGPDGVVLCYAHAIIGNESNWELAEFGEDAVMAYALAMNASTTCRADFNRDGIVTSDDIEFFVAAWINELVDFTCDGQSDITDLQKYLAEWQIGC